MAEKLIKQDIQDAQIKELYEKIQPNDLSAINFANQLIEKNDIKSNSWKSEILAGLEIYSDLKKYDENAKELWIQMMEKLTKEPRISIIWLHKDNFLINFLKNYNTSDPNWITDRLQKFNSNDKETIAKFQSYFAGKLTWFDATKAQAEILWKYEKWNLSEEEKQKQKELQWEWKQNTEKQARIELVNKTKDAQTALQSTIPELAKTPDENEKSQILTKLWVKNKEELDNRFKNPTKYPEYAKYKEAGMNTDNLLSFFHTQSQISENPELKAKTENNQNYLDFSQNFSQIQSDLKLFPQKEQLFTKAPNETPKALEPVPAQDMQNISDQSLANLSGQNPSIQKFTGLDNPQKLQPDFYATLSNEQTQAIAQKGDTPDYQQTDPRYPIFNHINTLRTADQKLELAQLNLGVKKVKIQDFLSAREDIQVDAGKISQQTGTQLVDFTMPQNLPTLAEQLNTIFPKANAEVQSQINIFFSQVQNFHQQNADILSKISDPNLQGKDFESSMATQGELSKYKITEMAHDTARREVAKGFLQNVAQNISSRVGNTNLGAEVQILPESIKMSENEGYTCEIQMAGNTESRTLTVSPDGTVQMTDLSHPDTQNKTYIRTISELGIKLPGLNDLNNQAMAFCSGENFTKALETAVESEHPFEAFQGTFTNGLRSDLQKKLSDQSSGWDETMLAHRMIANQTTTKRLGVLEDIANNNGDMKLINSIKKLKIWFFCQVRQFHGRYANSIFENQAQGNLKQQSELGKYKVREMNTIPSISWFRLPAFSFFLQFPI